MNAAAAAAASLIWMKKKMAFAVAVAHVYAKDGGCYGIEISLRTSK